MPQSLCKNLIHLIFSTKHREPWLTNEIRSDLHSCLGGILRQWRSPAVQEYIEGQEEHHRRQSFQDEFRAFLKKYAMEYDERYVWD